MVLVLGRSLDEGGAPCAVRKVGYFGPVSPDGQGDRSHYRGPRHMTAQIPTQVQTLR